MESTAVEIYVGDLPPQTDEQFLKSLFSECGVITECILKKHKTSASWSSGQLEHQK